MKHRPQAVRTDPKRTEAGLPVLGTCLACGAPLSGKQRRHCSASCKADWHRRERIRMAEHLSITAAAIELGMSRWRVRKAIDDGRLEAVMVPTAGRPRRDITRGELERFSKKR